MLFVVVVIVESVINNLCLIPDVGYIISTAWQYMKLTRKLYQFEPNNEKYMQQLFVHIC